MKRILPFCSLLILGGAAIIAGCQQDPNSTAELQSALPLKSSPPPAHPALVWTGAEISHGKTYSAIYVADTGVTNITAVQVASSSSSVIQYGVVPGWSPTGGSICFTQNGLSSIPDSIKALDVSVNSNGVPVGSNLRTIVGLQDRSVRLKNPFWSSTTSMGKIAYTTNDGATNSLYIVSQSGGTTTKIFSVDTGWVHFANPLGDPTWNADDSKLALIRVGSATTTIMIFNTSTWTYVDSITVSGVINGLEWSRSGMNKLAFGVYASGSYHLYYVDPTTGATPSTNGVVGQFPTWSPNNSSVMYATGRSLNKNVPFSSATTSVSSFSGLSVKWRR